MRHEVVEKNLGACWHEKRLGKVNRDRLYTADAVEYPFYQRIAFVQCGDGCSELSNVAFGGGR